MVLLRQQVYCLLCLLLQYVTGGCLVLLQQPQVRLPVLTVDVDS
jgi:hypothetical protein